MARGDELETRLIDFAVQIIRLCDRLPSSPAGSHIGRQLLRSGTSPASNYAEARSAESQRDFVHKLKIALKEMNESRIWMQIIIRSELLEASSVAETTKECEQLCRILSSSIKTSNKSRSAK